MERFIALRDMRGSCMVAALLWFLIPAEAWAVRPFVTDDARIVDYGQVEVESWLETTRSGGRFAPAPGYNIMAGTSVTDWLEIIAGSGVGRDAGGEYSYANPVLTAKMLLKKAEPNGAPGFAVSSAVAFDRGRGSMYEEGTVYNIIGMNTWRFRDDEVNVHINYGARRDNDGNGRIRTRPYWGVGADIAVYEDIFRFIAEAFAGDPLVPNAPSHAAQTGIRYMHSDYTQLDLTFGVDPALDDDFRRTGRYEYTAQIGIRFLFDAFTRDGKPGNPDGAPGLFR